MLCKRWVRGNCLILSLTIILLCLPLSVMAEEKSPDYYSVSEDLSFEVSASIASSWDNHANLEFVVANTGSETIHNWYFTFDLPYAIEGIWGAQVFESGSGVFTIKNAGWNQDVLPGNSVTFGMTVASLNGAPIVDLPTYYMLNTNKKLVDSSDYSVSYQEYSNWGNGFNGAILIENNSYESVEDWELRFSCGQTITEVAGAEFSFENGLYAISNNGSNQNLLSYSTTSLTVVGSCNVASSGLLLDNVELYSVGYAFALYEDTDQNGIADYIDFINGQSGETDITPTPTPDPSVTPTGTPAPTITGEPTPTPPPELDSDGDGIPDSVEAELGTDFYSPDSDEDGIGDGVEIMLGIDPLSDDSDDDGITDDQEDFDEDGLSLIDEMTIGTWPYTSDTDMDGISDGDEVNEIGTDPLNEDTDGDSIKDGDELKLGTNSLIPDSDGDGVPDGEERFLQTREEIINNAYRPEVNKVEVTLEGTGCLDSVMQIEDVYGIDKYSSEYVGLVGVPVDITYEGEFEEATITFYYDELLLSSADTNNPYGSLVEQNHVTTPGTLGIYYFDKENGVYVDCDATLDTSNNSISCKTTHFSTYMLVDKADEFFRWTSLKYAGDLHPSHEGYNGIDYVLEIPCVDSMTETDISEMNAIAFKIIDHMQLNDRMVVRGYQSWGSYVYSYTSDKELLKRQVEEWPWNSGDSWIGSNASTDDLIGTQLNAIEIFNIAASDIYHDSDKELVVIAFNNSTDLNCWVYSTTHRTLKEMTAYIFTLSSGDSETENLVWLNHVAGGGVIDCEGKTADAVYWEFASLYSNRQGNDMDPHTDDNEIGDGLWDIYEKQGLLCSNGQFYYTDPSKTDTDSDGLDDYKELGSCTVVEVSRTGDLYVDGEIVQKSDEDDGNLLNPQWRKYCHFLDYGTGRWTIYNVQSDPSIKDTDGDYYSDLIDPNPQDNDLRTIGLEGEFDPFTRSQEYVRVYDHPDPNNSNPSYGGDQRWLNMTNKFGFPLDKETSETACGLISYQDLILYSFTDIRDINYAQYYELLYDAADIFGDWYTESGVFYGSICDRIMLAGVANGRFVTSYPKYIDTDKPITLCWYIERMLRKGYPVIASICIDENYKLNYYRAQDNPPLSGQGTIEIGDCGLVFEQERSAYQHYFNITGLIYDEIAEDVYMRVSNHGREEYILLSEYIEKIENHRYLWSFSSWDLGNLIVCIL